MSATYQTLLRSIVSAIRMAYVTAGLQCPMQIRADSTRALASSVAVKAVVPLVDICKAAMWSASSTFVRRYLMDVDSKSDAAVGTTVLQSLLH